MSISVILYLIMPQSNVNCLLLSTALIPNKLQYRRYHRINMSDLNSDLKNTSFVKSSANAVVDFYEQYVHGLGDVLDTDAPLVSRLTKKDATDWLSDFY